MNFYYYFKNIKFSNYNFKNILSKILRGGYLVAPAASALVNIFNDRQYYNSLKKADVVICDSGFFCILVRLFKKIRLKKLSGYLFLKNFITSPYSKKYKILSIDPNNSEKRDNIKILYKFNIRRTKHLVSKVYHGKIIHDYSLLNNIKIFKPDIILINIGGGKQEQLANFIKKNVKFKVSILCLGAAIGFLTKKQAPINDFYDKNYLGWLIRLIHNKYFITRVITSLKLIRFF